MPVNDATTDMVMIPARRIRVSIDLGTVRAGDHVLVVGNIVVALDTSRVPEPRGPLIDSTVETTRETTSHKAKKLTAARLTPNHVYHVIREHAPISSISISDRLGFERTDSQGRGKVARILQKLVRNGGIRRHQDDRIRQFRFEVATAAQPEPPQEKELPAFA